MKCEHLIQLNTEGRGFLQLKSDYVTTATDILRTPGTAVGRLKAILI